VHIKYLHIALCRVVTLAAWMYHWNNWRLCACCRIFYLTVSTKKCTDQTLSISQLRRLPIRHRTWSYQSLTDVAKESLDLQLAKERYCFFLWVIFVNVYACLFLAIVASS